MSDARSNSGSADRYIVRMPDGMRDRIRDAAKANKRSMNAEIVATLEEKYPAPPPPILDPLQGGALVFKLLVAYQSEKSAAEKRGESNSSDKSLLDQFNEFEEHLREQLQREGKELHAETIAEIEKFKSILG